MEALLMKKSASATLLVAVCMATVWTAAFVGARADDSGAQGDGSKDRNISARAANLIDQGRQTFRFDTFGDEAFWGGTLQLHQAIEGKRFGGVGDGVSPATALAVGLKIDSTMLP